jgi:hypothetical protein
MQKCEGMNPHTPNWTLTLGIEISMDSWIFKEKDLKGQNSLDWKVHYTMESSWDLNV